MAALNVKLSAKDIKEIRQDIEKVEIVGERYPNAFLDFCYADTPELPE